LASHKKKSSFSENCFLAPVEIFTQDSQIKHFFYLPYFHVYSYQSLKKQLDIKEEREAPKPKKVEKRKIRSAVELALLKSLPKVPKKRGRRSKYVLTYVTDLLMPWLTDEKCMCFTLISHVLTCRLGLQFSPPICG
jgi:hypothetical protein